MRADQRRADLLARLQGIARAFELASVEIVGTDGVPVLRTGEPTGADRSHRKGPPEPASERGRVRLHDIRAGDALGRFVMELLVPLIPHEPGVVGEHYLLVLRIDPARYLFPLIQSWPTPSATAETFLFRREGSDVVYLNPLRHHQGAPLSLRFNAADTDLLAAQVLRGHEGVLEGTDYRGRAVVGAGRRVADSPWFLISKVDTAEIYAPIERGTRNIIATILGFVLVCGLAVWLWWRQQCAVFHLDQVRARSEQRALAQHYDYLLRHANDVILLADQHGDIVEINDRCEAVYGYRPDELRGQSLGRLCGERTTSNVAADWARIAAEGRLVESVHRHRDGARVPVEISARALRAGESVYYQAVIRDISARRQVEADMRLYASVFATTSEAVLVTDAQQRIVAVNPAFTDITGYDAADVLGHTPRILSSGRQDAAFYRRMWASLMETGRWQGEIWNRRKSGDIYPQWQSICAIRAADGGTLNYVAIFSDIGTRKSAEEHIRYLAQHDALTGLPNRALMQDRLHQALADAKREGHRVGVLLIDLDRFKYINDSLGHTAGDQLLKGVAARLKGCVHENDTVSRLGGDEFVVVLSHVADADDIMAAAQRMLAALAGSFDLCGHDIRVTPSIGACIYPDDGCDIDSLIRNADTAMYQAKEDGRNGCRFFTQEMNARVTARMTMEAELRAALADDQFALHYQPQVDIRNGRIVGVEALVRWNHPQQGLISPAHFIPVAEECGLIVQLGERVLRDACAQGRRWLDLGIASPPISVNVSALQLRDHGFAELVARILRETGLPPALLDLEITESAIMQHGEDNVTVLEHLKALGVTLSIDDFGTGYSSLAYLKRFPIDRLKIDRSFVRDLASDANDLAIIKAIVALGHSLSLRVIAEGVETAAQMSLLRAIDCGECQGYLIARPAPAADIPALLRTLRVPGMLTPVDSAGQRDGPDIEPLPHRRAAMRA